MLEDNDDFVVSKCDRIISNIKYELNNISIENIQYEIENLEKIANIINDLCSYMEYAVERHGLVNYKPLKYGDLN